MVRNTLMLSNSPTFLFLFDEKTLEANLLNLFTIFSFGYCFYITIKLSFTLQFQNQYLFYILRISNMFDKYTIYTGILNYY